MLKESKGRFEMKRFGCTSIITVLGALTSAIFAITVVAQTIYIDDVREHVLMVGGEELHFEARPELGYVVKTRQEISSIGALDGILKNVRTVDISLIAGSARKGMSIVHDEHPADENRKTIRLLRSRSEVQYAAPLFSSNGQTVAIIPEIVVRVKPGMEIEQVEAICETAGCMINKRMEFTEQEYLIEVLGSDAEAVFSAVEQLGQAQCVEWACPNSAFRPKLCGQNVLTGVPYTEHIGLSEAEQDVNAPGIFPNDEYFPMQWHLYNTGQSGGTPGADIRAPEAWEITTGDPNIIIAVIDVGVDSNHPDLIGNLVPGYDFYENDDRPDPSHDVSINAHGTACAGLIAAQGNNELGVTGVTWGCKIMPIRVSEFPTNQTWNEITEADSATAFRWAAAHGADVFSNSWHLFYSPQPIMHSAISDVTRPGGLGRDGKGCVFLSIAVGDSTSITTYPQKYPEVIVVGATDHNDVWCSYSNYGPELDIVAPTAPSQEWADLVAMNGRGWVWTTDIIGLSGFSPRGLYPDILDYTLFEGTSAACPIAAGVAALILSIEPNLTGDEVQHFLERSAKDLGDPGRDDYYGWGRVDAREALDMVLAKRADLNDDWKVDIEDLLILIEFWRTGEPSADIAPAAKRDGIVDEQDIELLMRYWQTEIPQMDPGPQ